MKPPPLLLGAALLFWGWETDHLVAGVVMAGVLESAQWIKARWEFTDQDFRRIWVFCALLTLVSAAYAFTANGGAGDLRGLLQNPNLQSEHAAAATGARAVAVWLRWLPVAFFLFIAAQTFNSREGIPPETISLLMRWRWQKARKLGGTVPPTPNVNVAFPYFAVCLFAAGFRVAEDWTFFWGLCGLLMWALWSQRPQRFSLAAWAGAVTLAVALGYGGQLGVSRLYRLLDGYSPPWLSRSTGGSTDPTRSKTALGHIGRLQLSGKIVIRLEPREGNKAPGLLREASYHTYRNGYWLADSVRDQFERIQEDANLTTWRLLPAKTNTAAVNIACYLPGGNALLPLPAGSGRLEHLSIYLLQKNPLGAVFVQGPGLVVFDALYGPGDLIDSPANANEDLAVPPRETNALDQVIAELQLQPQNRKQALRAIQALFQDKAKFTYSTWQGVPRAPRTNETVVSRFLLKTHSGHCEYFATATVLLLRRLEIPARYAVGYAVHECSGRKYVIRQRDAHAWCLVWNESAHTWQDFDTTPASWVAIETSRASPLQSLRDLWSLIVFEFSKFRWGQTHLRQYILWTLGPVLALLLYQIIFRSRRRQRGPSQELAGLGDAWQGLDSEFYEIERRMAARGAGRQPSEPLSAWLLRAMKDPALAGLRSQLPELLRLHYRYRFDPQGLPPADREALRRQANGCLAKIE